ncbi:MAG: hypothetical protein RIS29_2610 [Bacteroidota bacterium]|jgi:hypothetical protein
MLIVGHGNIARKPINYLNMKKRNIPSKRGSTSTPHCSSLMSVTKKIKELSLFFSSLEECTKSLTGFIYAFKNLLIALAVLGFFILTCLSAL